MKVGSGVTVLALPCLCACSAASLSAQEPTYWKDVRPVLRKHCTVCHSTRNLQEPDLSGGLALDSYEAVRKGSVRQVVRPGKSGQSLMVRMLLSKDTSKRMPLAAPPLPADQIALIRRWIDAGAPEGTRPAEAPAVSVAVKPGPRRKLDVVLPTSAIPPAGALGGGSPSKLALALKVGPLAPVVAVAFSPDGGRGGVTPPLLAVGSYGQATVWDLTAGRPVKVLTNVLGAVNDLRFSPDGKLLAVAGGQPSAKGDLRLYRVADWQLLAVLRGHEDVVFSVAWRPDGKKIASASFDRTARVWDVATGRAEKVHTGHSDFVYAVAYSPDGRRIVSASKDRTVKVVQAETGKSLLTFSGMEQDVLAVAVSPDGQRVVSSGFESALHWWDARTGAKIKPKAQGGHSVAVNELAFSKDGKVLVSAGADGTVRVWDGTSGGPLRSLRVGSLVYAVAISPDGKRIASGSFDGLVRLWDQASGRHLLTLLSLPAHGGEADWLALTPEGYATGSPGVEALGRWQMAGREAASARAWEALRQPAAVLRALRGEAVPAPVFKR
jgi:WD40 repeat protein